MRELVTVIGGAGYIGSLVVKKLIEEDYRVRVFDSFLGEKISFENYDNDYLEIIEGDVCNIKALSRAIAGADAVVMLASVVGRRVNDFQPEFMREVNLLATSVAVDASIEHGVSRFIFSSTDSIYGVQSGVMYETGTPAPVSLYSRLKLRMEELVIRSKKRDFHPTALRISTCYGISPRMRFDLVINALIRDAVVKRELNITSGDENRAFIHVDDVARAIVLAVKAHVSLVSGQVFNLSAEGQELTLNQLANLTKQVVPDILINIGNAKPDLAGYRVSCSKMAKVLDFKPHFGILAGMEEVRDALIRGDYEDPYAPKYSNTSPNGKKI